MNTKSKWKYILLGASAFGVIMVIVYLRVATYYKIPLGSFSLPPKDMRNLSSASGVKPTSIELYTSRGVTSYIVRGKFVTTPMFEQQKSGSTSIKVLRSDFVIDEDPAGHKIPVIMDRTTYLGRFPGSLQGIPVWKSESADIIRQSITVNAPAQLRLVPNSSETTAYDQSVRQTMESIMAGNWSIANNFIVHPFMVGVVK